MSLRKQWGIGLLLMGIAMPFVTGCDGSNSPPPQEVIESINLRELGEAYRTFVLAKKTAPTKLADIREYEGGYPMAVAGLKSGELEVFWGGELVDPEAIVPTVKTDKVLAFEAKVPKEGGYVMLANREIKKMTPEEFQAAPKAAETASGTGTAKAAKSK